jgi:hypothetical protein
MRDMRLMETAFHGSHRWKRGGIRQHVRYLRPGDTDIPTHIGVVDQVLHGEDHPGGALVEPDDRTDSHSGMAVDVSPLLCFVDPQGSGLTGGVSEAHRFEEAQHPRLGVEAYHEALLDLTEGDHQSDGVIIHELPPDASISEEDRGQPYRFTPQAYVGGLVNFGLVLNQPKGQLQTTLAVEVVFIDLHDRHPEEGGLDGVAAVLPSDVGEAEAPRAGDPSHAYPYPAGDDG